MAKRHIVVDDETFEQIYYLKGPGRSMLAVIKDLLNAVYPPEKEDVSQTSLRCCPSCGLFALANDGDGLYCKNCDYEPEESEL
jgi:ribosomal protein S27AE